jgi:hypothetical protein
MSLADVRAKAGKELEKVKRKISEDRDLNRDGAILALLPPSSGLVARARPIVEMLTGNLPAPDSLPMPLLEMGVKPSLLKLLEQALSSNPRHRPTIEEIVDELPANPK